MRNDVKTAGWAKLLEDEDVRLWHENLAPGSAGDGGGKGQGSLSVPACAGIDTGWPVGFGKAGQTQSGRLAVGFCRQVA
jgi:hypothetical protein